MDIDKAKIKTVRDLAETLETLEHLGTRAQSVLIETKVVVKDIRFIIEGIISGSKSNYMLCRNDGCYRYGEHKYGVDEWMCEEHWKQKVEEDNQQNNEQL